MRPEQFNKMRILMDIALPEAPLTPTNQSCSVELLAKETVLRQDCRRTAACALCALSGLTCENIVGYAQIHDGFAAQGRLVSGMRRSGAGFAG